MTGLDVALSNVREPVTLGPFRLMRTGLMVEDGVRFDEWEAFGGFLTLAEGAVHFWIGDWLNYGERRWGEKYAQAMDETRFAYKTVANDAYVASRIDSSRRRENLSVGHHAAVASLEPAAQDKWLALAENNSWSRAELRRQLRVERALLQIQPGDNEAVFVEGKMLTVLPGLGQFDLVVADPLCTSDCLDETRQWLTALKPSLKPWYTIFWFCPPCVAADVEMEFRRLDLPVQSHIVWHWRIAAGGSTTSDRFVESWTMIIHASNRALNWPPELGEDRLDVQRFPMLETDQNSVPQQKPLTLIQRLVACGSRNGDRVLDPFAREGTTGAACAGSRPCVLIEERPDYVALLRQRFAAHVVSERPADNLQASGNAVHSTG